MERNIIKQGYEIINSRYKMTASETKFVLGAIAQIKMEDEDFHEYIIPVADLEDKLKFAKNKHSRMKAFAKSLMSKPLDLDTGNGFEVYNWFSKIKYVNSEAVFKVHIHKDLKPFLLNLSERITKTDLQHVIQLKSNYAIRIFHLLKEYEKIGHREFELSKLHELMQTPKSYQKLYTNFKQKVLDIAVKEINLYTDIKVSYKESQKIRKKVTHIDFIIHKNNEDLKVFIEHIRREYVNVHIATVDEIIIKCSEDGLLYNGANGKTLKKEIALKYWERMHENREEILKALNTKYPKLEGLYE
jgi:plasmid replication initiation protein